MSKVFKITPKKIKKTNATVLTPEMSITVTLKQHTSDPFYNGAKEIKEAYLRQYNFDYQKACCSKNDFNFQRLD
jgi:CRISPR/Cas system-associated protein Cas5 (RAMP superfamily)